jgi:magnesium-transporting ATPase (P-type)
MGSEEEISNVNFDD